MVFDGNEGSLILMDEGAQMTANFRAAQPNSNLCIFFGKTMLNELLNQPDAMGLRFYFALNGENQMTLVTVAANSNGNDIQDKVGNKGFPCPSECCAESPLAAVGA
ncbi:hypothetical protein [Hymenobacter jeollabukensis]|uniref:Uncharacterized protein n=1 Tax=Hymenobacter jeollabukensis TaxID=2025313 RepID=A0A5R8WL30_9BACT|nr:hypothetical protein [Hymenobacter jeollabukensis]TLM89544.1 hypothetical protein FDY95_20960 [Hymenobacter jeollabukensis]